MTLHIIYLAILLLSSVAGLLYFKHLKSRKLTLLPFYLLFVFMQELIAAILAYASVVISTGIIYNIYNPITTIFFSFLFTSIPFNQRSKKLVFGLLITYLAAVVVTFIFIQPIHIYNNYVFLTGSMITVLNAILFLFNYFKLDNRGEEKKWQPVIWIVIGIVAFYPVVNIAFSFYKYLVTYDATLWGMRLYRMIPQIMSIFMYSCFIRAFYLCQKKN
jgi:hypothetical protein